MVISEGSESDRTTQRGQNGMLLRDNIFGSIEEDVPSAAISPHQQPYYSVADFTVRDYVGGMQDLQEGVIRLIGNPETRYREVRFGAARRAFRCEAQYAYQP